MPIGFSITGALPPSIETLRSFLNQYQRLRPSADFDINPLSWADAWPFLVRVSIHKTGAAISEVGAPWVTDFAAMNGLRPFSSAEIEAAGGLESFFSAPWKNGMAAPAGSASGKTGGLGSPSLKMYGLPSRVDVRMIYYWKDMLEKAGVDPATAFTDPQHLEQTLEQLRASEPLSGLQFPWVCPADSSRNAVYNMASWIWAYGGDFVDEAGQPAFHQPAAIEGMTAYFQLHRYLASPTGSEPYEHLFANRRAAVMVAGTWFHRQLSRDSRVPEAQQLLPLLGAAHLPGPAFVGGTSFVIWQHSGYETTRAVLDMLAQFMQSPAILDYCLGSDMLPARIDGFSHEELAGDPFLGVMRASLQNGRSHSSARLWVLIADRMAAMCGAIWSELHQKPNQDVRSLVKGHAEMLSRRLAISFSTSGT